MFAQTEFAVEHPAFEDLLGVSEKLLAVIESLL